jgi:transcriptional regulator with XRE-family HTH domain
MPIRQSPISEAARRASHPLDEVIRDVRLARVEAGLTQADVAAAVGVSRPQLDSIEIGRRVPSVQLLARLSAVVGLELSLRVFPAGAPLRDAGHLRLLARFLSLIGNRWHTRAEAPVSSDPRDHRAFDMVLTAGTQRVAVEAVSRLVAADSQVRRIMLKLQVARVDAVILVLADTRHNRLAIAAAAPTLRASFPLGPRAVFARLREGRAPAANGIVLV